MNATGRVLDRDERSGVSCDIDAAYRAHERACYYRALKLVHDKQMAHDVVQDVFTSLVQHPGRFDPARGPMSAWLGTITHHKAVDLIRRNTRTLPVPDSDSLLSAMTELTAGPEATASSNDEANRVRAALRTLPPNQLELIVLAYYEGCTQSAIARRLGIPLGTVKSRTLTAMRSLRTTLTAGAER